VSDRGERAHSYLSGVQAVEETVAAFDAGDWRGRGCGEWNAADTVRHLVGVIGWYEQWLERALSGVSAVPFPESDFETRNAAAVGELQHLDGPAALADFGTRARSYLDRTAGHLDAPFGYPGGTVTVGLHLGVAAAEWHLHAWDVAAGRGTEYEPDDPASLFLGAGACVAAAKGGIGGKILGLLVPIAARRSPWQTLLKESGRSPPR